MTALLRRLSRICLSARGSARSSTSSKSLRRSTPRPAALARVQYIEQPTHRDLRANPPATIVVAEHDQNNLLAKASLYYIEDFPEFRAFLVENYRGEGAVGRFHVLMPVDRP